MFRREEIGTENERKREGKIITETEKRPTDRQICIDEQKMTETDRQTNMYRRTKDDRDRQTDRQTNMCRQSV